MQDRRLCVCVVVGVVVGAMGVGGLVVVPMYLSMVQQVQDAGQASRAASQSAIAMQGQVDRVMQDREETREQLHQLQRAKPGAVLVVKATCLAWQSFEQESSCMTATQVVASMRDAIRLACMHD